MMRQLLSSVTNDDVISLSLCFIKCFIGNGHDIF